MPVRKLIDGGFLIGEDVKEDVLKLKETHVNFLLSLEKKPLIINKNVLLSVLYPPIQLAKKKKHVGDKRSMQDLVNVYNNRYSCLQEALVKNPELVGLVSVSGLSSEKTSLIGMVIKDEEKIELEDPTGMILLETQENLCDGDVVGVFGKKENGKFIVDRVFYPNIPLKGVCCAHHPAVVLIAKSVGEKEKSFLDKVNYCIFSDHVDVDERVTSVIMNEYGEFDIGGVGFLVSGGAAERCGKCLGLDERRSLLEILKRRHVFSKPEHFIENVPDVFLTLTEKTYIENYKGTTVIGLGSESVVLDLATRDAKLI